MAKISGVTSDASDVPVNGVSVRAHRDDTGEVLGDATSAAGSYGDPTFATTTKILLPFDSDLTDSSVLGTTWTAQDGAVIGTTTKVFGAGALDCTSVDARIEAAATADLRLIGPYSLQMRVRFTELADTTFLLGIAGGVFLELQLSTLDNKVRARATGVTIYTDSAVSAGTWYDLEVSRDELDEIRFFLDGAPQTDYLTGTSSATNMSSDATWKLGAFPTWAGDGGGGRVMFDNFRLKIGEVVHSAAFTPDAEAFPTTGGTSDGMYEITTAYTGEVYVVARDPVAAPTLNHRIHRTFAV